MPDRKELPGFETKTSTHSFQKKRIQVRPISEASKIGDRGPEMTQEAEESDFRILEPVVWFSVIASLILFGLILCDLAIRH